MALVLVVDDEDDIRELVRINLELDGHVVATARDGREALEYVATRVPDVIVLDVMMPAMDGWEVLSRMKAQNAAPISQVPVLMLTARTEEMDRLRGGIEGAIRYITKPFSLTDLRAEVRAALEGDPEPVKRRRAQHEALEQLARMERGDAAPPTTARPRLTKLESPPEPKAPSFRTPRLAPDAMGSLSDKQRELLGMVSSTPTVREAAERLGVSRSNVYASLRRIARKLDLTSVPELVALARQGGLPVDDAD
ncbi:MAG TPA: response regulator [Acidimicrobiales bacterium]|jgi:CheY-like chemotaxis protein/DNA-binding CsgD family transcriptional regulator